MMLGWRNFTFVRSMISHPSSRDASLKRALRCETRKMHRAPSGSRARRLGTKVLGDVITAGESISAINAVSHTIITTIDHARIAAAASSLKATGGYGVSRRERL